MSLGDELNEMARVFAQMALAASAPVLRHYAEGVKARLKPDQSPVTAADEEAEVIIMEALTRTFPGVPVVAEEACARNGLPRTAMSEAIFVDPLDGTREFLAHNGEFTVNIGLVRHGAPVAGAVYAPAFGRLWWGGASAFGAHLAAGQPLPQPGDCPPLQTRRPASPLVVLESRSHQTPKAKAALARLTPSVARPMGSSMKFCLIASGEADVCLRFGPTMEWDTAAGDAILRAAGGLTVTADGAPLTYGKVEAGFRNPGFIAWGDPGEMRDLSEFATD